MPAGLVHIPRHLLHAGLDDLPDLGVSEAARSALRALLADLPLVPDGRSSAQLVGPPPVTLSCLAVLARHVGQALRDRNLTIAHDRQRLHAERAKLLFLSAEQLQQVLALGDERPAREAVLFVAETTSTLGELLVRRRAAGLASFVTARRRVPELVNWRIVDLTN